MNHYDHAQYHIDWWKWRVLICFFIQWHL